MDANLDALARAELSLAHERQRNTKLEDELRRTREKLYALEAKIIVNPKLREDMRAQIEHLKRENNVLKSRAGNVVKVGLEEAHREKTRPKPSGTRRKEGDGIMAKMREMYPEFWAGT